MNTKSDAFEEGTINNCQQFMNSAVQKYTRIIAEEGEFKGSTTTMEEDIIAMLSSTSKKKTTKRKTEDDGEDIDKPPTKSGKGLPPFLTHTKYRQNGKEVPYKVGDEKKFNRTVWYYCDCPNHKEGARWHTFKAEDCRTRKRWMKKEQEAKKEKEKDDQETPSGNLVSEDDSKSSSDKDGTPDVTSDNITALLASAMNLVKDNPVLNDSIADALNHVE